MENHSTPGWGTWSAVEVSMEEESKPRLADGRGSEPGYLEETEPCDWRTVEVGERRKNHFWLGV
jgi:hypothetical protein